MAPRWEPKAGDPVGANEHTGRRLFERRPLKGAKDQKVPDGSYDLTHFEESRDPGEVSLDRLGKTSVDKKVKSHLERLAHADASRRSRDMTFEGWAVTKAKDLENPAKGHAFKVIPSPIAADAEKNIEANAYHAHVERPREGNHVFSAYDTALFLKTIFERNYIRESATSSIGPEESSGSLLEKLRLGALQLVDRLRQLWR